MLESASILCPTVAAVEPLTVGMWGVTTLVQIAMGIALFALKGGQDKRRDELQGMGNKIDTLEERLHKANEAKIDARLSDISHKLNGHAAVLTGTMDKLALNVRDADKRISDAEKDLIRTAGAIKESVRECAPTKEQHDALAETVKDLAKTVADVSRESISVEDLKRALREVKQS